MALLNTSTGPERVQTFPTSVGTTQVAGAATAVTAFLIGTTEGGAPVNVPTRVTNLDDFVTTFGGPDEVLYDAYYAVKGYYDNAGTGAVAIIVNVGSSPTATSFVGNAALQTGLRALDAIDDVTLVTVPNLPIDLAYIVDGAVIDYTETVRAEFGATLSTCFSVLAMPSAITKADTEDTLVTGQFISQSGSGPYLLKLQKLSTAVAEVSTFTLLTNGAGITQGSFVSLYNASATQVKFWFDVDAAGTGAPSGTVVMVSILSADTATQVAVKLAAAIDAYSGALVFNVPVPSTATLTVTNLYTGPMTDVTASQVLQVTAATSIQGAYGNLTLSGIKAGMLLTNSADSFRATITAVNDTTDEVTIATLPSPAFTAGDDVLLKRPSAVSYKEDVINNPSKAAAWYFNNLVVLDEAAAAAPGDLVTVGPEGHVCGVMGRIDANTAVGGVSHAPAGIQYAGIAGIRGLGLALSERLDGGPLRLAFINRITSFPGSGNIIFGGYTAAGSAAAADDQLVQVIRSIQFIKASLDRGLVGFLWENFDGDTISKVANTVESFLSNHIYLFPKGVATNQQYQVISIVPTQDELDLGLLRIKLRVKPNKAVRFIEVTLEYPIPTT